MSKKKNLSPKMQVWVGARKRFHLSHAQVQMARELGLNAKKLGKMDNDDQEPWKMPLAQYIEHLYFKNFRKERLDVVLPIEEKIRSQKEKKANEHPASRSRRNGPFCGAGGAKNQTEDLPQKRAFSIRLRSGSKTGDLFG
jgi:hypothetical protein